MYYTVILRPREFTEHLTLNRRITKERFQTGSSPTSATVIFSSRQLRRVRMDMSSDLASALD